MRTLAGSAVSNARAMFKWNQSQAPIKETIELPHVGAAGLYLLSDLSTRVTGEVLHVDSGYNVIGIPNMEEL